MLAQLICFLLGHTLDKPEEIECPQPHIRATRGNCARCGISIFELHDLRDELPPVRRMRIRFPPKS